MRPRIALVTLVLQRYFVRGGSPYPPRMGEIAVFGAVGARSTGSGQAPTHRAKCLCSVVALVLSFCLACGVSAGVETAAARKDRGFGPPSRAKWAPLPDFTDEFEGNRLDPAKWHDHNPQWKGRKPALFRPSNVRVEGGKLHLTMRCEDVPGAPDGYHTFTSAAVKSTKTVLYGYFEARCKAMASRGSSAFWFYNSSDPKWHTEIDVFEIGGGAPKHKRTVHMNVHVFRTPTEKRHWSKAGTYTAPADLADSYHVYGLLWTKETIAWYFDGQCVRTIKNTHWRQPLHLNFDSETMPDWFGLPDKKNLPSTFSIAYVRSWKRVEPAAPAAERPVSEADRRAVGRLAAVLEVSKYERIAGPAYLRLAGGVAALTVTYRQEHWRVKDRFARQSARDGVAQRKRFMQLPLAERLQYMDRFRSHIQVWLVPLAKHPDAGPDLKVQMPLDPTYCEHVQEAACMGRGHGYAWFAYAYLSTWAHLAVRLDLAGGDDFLAACVRGMLVEDAGRRAANTCLYLFGRAGPQALPYVEKAIADRHPERQSLVWILYQSDDPAVVRWLIAHAHASDAEVAAGVRLALRANPTPEAGPLYVKWLQDSIGGDGTVFWLAVCQEAGVTVPMRLLRRVMDSPAHLREYALAFRMARAQQQRPVPEALLKAQERIIHESFASIRQKGEYDRAAVEQATRTLLASDDHEAVAVIGVRLATWTSKCDVEIPRRAGRTVLRHLPDDRGRNFVDALRRSCRSKYQRERLDALAETLAEEQ